MSDPRRVVVVVFDGVQALDVAGPWEVLHSAAQLRPPGYALELATPGGGAVQQSSGLLLGPCAGLGSSGPPIDTILVAGGVGVSAAAADGAIPAWLREEAPRARRVTSVCSGAFLLAEAGLLDGRAATTHWAHCARLQERHPQVDVRPDPIFVRDGNVTTSAGVTAGMDLALALVEEDLGRRVALEIARWLVLFVKRPGGQAQFSAGLAAQTAHREPLRELQDWIADHLHEDLTVPVLAGRAHMSERNFARAFRREAGATPAVYVEALRVERARAALEESEAPLAAVARAVGFGTVETLRRAFHRRLGVGPAAYRDRFRAAA